MKIRTSAILPLFCLLSAATHAESLWPITETTQSSPLLTLSLGPAETQGNRSQTFFLQPELEKRYKMKRTPQTFGLGEIFLGWQMPMMKYLLGQVGVAVEGGVEAPIKGDIWEDADPDFNNFTFKYKVNHAHVALKGKLLTDTVTIVQPYVSGSIGYGINRSHGFSIKSKICEEIPAPNFTVRDENGFAYTFGFGIQTSYSDNWQAGIGYEMADWGKTGLGRAPGQTMNRGLNDHHLYTQQVLLSLSYVFTSYPSRNDK
jgi:opacity protein-like surface antigen